MGCCCSTSNKPKSQLSPESDQYHRRASTDLHKSLPIQDEETVKEVLSETHVPKSQPISIAHNCETRESQHYIKKDELISPEEITTENSDLRSLTDSLSTTITTVAEDDGEVTQRRISRNSAGKVPRKRTLSGSVPGGGARRPPARRAAQLPVKRVHAHARVSSFEIPPAARLRNAGYSSSLGRDAGDCSRRGIRSLGRRGEAGVVHRRNPNKNVKKEERRGLGSGEWLENSPIISLDLECFIFL